MKAEPRTKKILKQKAKTTVDATFHFIRWMFFLLVVYISVVTAWGYLTSGEEFLTQIIALSVGGFWAFFFGYFGWRLAESIEEHFNIKKRV
jgi:quinol-cytochrome oxidoreductase complex cytochrome b subunit